jgi:hypothetical protein
MTEQWNISTLLTLTGIFIVSLIPPKNLIHPVLNLWNEESKKCIASLRDSDHVEVTIDHVSFRDCIGAGYKVVRVHCFLEFNCIESLWRESTLRGVVEKTINSKKAPDDMNGFIEAWDEAFPGVGNMFMERWDRWVRSFETGT